MTALKKYEHQGNWEESLYIFLFVHLIHKKIEAASLTLERYPSYELHDMDIATFNKWIEDGNPSYVPLEAWLKANAASVEAFRTGFGTIYQPKVELWSDRVKTDYYREKLQNSFGFENYLEDFFRKTYGLELKPYLTPEGQYKEGENELGIEIKNDTLIKKYGNLYIEYAEKSSDNRSAYIRSGILKEDKSIYFLIGDTQKFWIFRKQRLLEIYREEAALRKANKPSRRGIQFKVKPTSLGFTYPIRLAEAEAISLDQLVKELKEKH